MAIQAKTIEQILQDISDSLVAQGALVNDMGDGAKLRMIARAFAAPLAEAWSDLAAVERDSNIATARNDSLDLLVNTFGLFRKTGNQAAGSLLAIPYDPTTVEVIQPGEIFLVGNSTLVSTGEAVLASPYALVPAEAGLPGSRFNLPGNTVVLAARDVLNEKFAFVVGETLNAQGQGVGSFAGGEDREEDDDLRGRFADFIQSLTRATYKAVYQAVLGIPDIKSLTLVENVPMIGFISLYVDDGSSNTAIGAGLKAQIEETLLEWRAAGIGLRIRPLEKVVDDVVVDLTVDKTVVPADVEAAVTTALERLLNGYAMGETVYLSRIVDVAFNTPGVRNVRVLGPTEDVTVRAHQVFRPRSVSVNAHT